MFDEKLENSLFHFTTYITYVQIYLTAKYVYIRMEFQRYVSSKFTYVFPTFTKLKHSEFKLVNIIDDK